ncbi:MAG: Crp/Fnr family transcriptional regulator [Microscillaceae bacterium]|jgi:CRP-like cAMP-binding protein|nr:Crp/Fnr family transcriptional regulator [Microscillaceae bacterium]
MDLRAYRTHNDSFYQLSETNWKKLAAVCFVKSLKKGEFLIQTGQICSITCFIQKGILRSFLYVDGVECTYEFYPDGAYVTDYESFRLQTPATFNIEALEDCELICLKAEDFARLHQEALEFNILTKAVIEKRFMQMLKLSRSLRFQNPTQRYTTFLKHFPSVPNRVPQYMIASYLGIKPETLSRVRSKLAKQKK